MRFAEVGEGELGITKNSVNRLLIIWCLCVAGSTRFIVEAQRTVPRRNAALE